MTEKTFTVDEIEVMLGKITPRYNVNIENLEFENQAMCDFINKAPAIIRQLLKERKAYREVAKFWHESWRNVNGQGKIQNHFEVVDAEAQRIIKKGE